MGSTVLVGIISDTHDNVQAVESAIAVFEDRGIETVIHCGDFIAPPVIPLFESFEVHGVLGNNDGELDGLEAAFRALGNASVLHGRFGALELGNARFALLHGEETTDVDTHAASGEFDYVCYGHHHVHERRTVEDCVVINPGAHFPTVPEPHRTVCLLETETAETEFVPVLT